MDKELRQAFEETTTKNVKANIEFSQDTRKLVRELEEEVRTLKNVVMNYEAKYTETQKQLANILTKLYSGGTDGS